MSLFLMIAAANFTALNIKFSDSFPYRKIFPTKISGG